MTATPTATRLIVLDTETTGLSPQEGHRIIEIGCVELVNRRATGQYFHHYLNPERIIDEAAIAVHGITNEQLENQPKFKDIADEFLRFIEGAELVIHNAPFDVGFLNHELALLSDPDKSRLESYCTIFDTLAYARKKHPGQRNGLDALCKRYNVDNSKREWHGALLDAQILAEVFLFMTGGQFSLWEEETATSPIAGNVTQTPRQQPAIRTALKIIACSPEEQQAHEALIATITKAAGNCLWPKPDA